MVDSKMVQVVILFMLLAAMEGAMGGGSDFMPGTVHTIVSVECTTYFSFQTLALLYSFKKVGQPGNFTRIMACAPHKLREFSEEDLGLMNTHITPQFARNPTTGETYPPYNKPLGIMHWLENARPKEEWVLIVDSDIIFRRPLLPEKMKVKEGWAVAAHYNYLKGGRNELSDKHIPEVEKKNDNFAGEPMRRADEAGSFYFVRTSDLRKIAPLWKKYTEDVRADKDAWHLAGDSGAKKGEAPWIAEMYGWIYAAAKLGIRHMIDPNIQMYPGYRVSDIPKLTHYGLNHKIGDNFVFDKHPHYHFNFTRCPPWDVSYKRDKDHDYGLFPHPPFPNEVLKKEMTAQIRYGELMTIEVVNTLNQALCERHRNKCMKSEQLTNECNKVDLIGAMLEQEFATLDQIVCRDLQSSADCIKYRDFVGCMDKFIYVSQLCRKTCGLCDSNPIDQVVWGDGTSPVPGKLSQQQREPGNSSITVVSQKETRKKAASAQKKSRLQHLYVEMLDSECRRLDMTQLRKTSKCKQWAIKHGIEIGDMPHTRGALQPAPKMDEPYENWMGVSLFPLIVCIAIFLFWFTSRKYRKIAGRTHKRN